MQQELQRLKPLHTEIMRRLIIGQTQRQIAEDMGLNEGRLSIIVRSPLFKLELKKLQARREERIFSIQEKLFEAGEKGVQLHLDIIEDNFRVKGSDGAETYMMLPVELRQRSATAVLAIVGRITKATAPGGDGGDESYERILRETTTREVLVKGKVGGDGDDKVDAQIF